MGIKIVVFGCDNSGKTTLCNCIANSLTHLDFKVIPPLGPASLEEQLNRLEEIASDPGNLILDRFPLIEECVCGKILRGRSNFDELEDKSLMYKCLDEVDLFIHCNPKLSVIKKWDNRDQMQGVKENVGQLYLGYQEIADYMRTTPLKEKLVSYDYSTDLLGWEFTKLISLISAKFKIKNQLSIKEDKEE